jgi:hypothetical protein
MSNQTRSSGGDALLVRRLFQTDPLWYEDYWYGSVRPAVPSSVRRCFAALVSFATKIATLHKLAPERPSDYVLPETHEAH